MSDNLRQVACHTGALTQWYPGQLSGQLAGTCSPLRHSSAASWAARAPSCPTSPRKCPTAPNPRAASHACAVVRQRPHPGGGVLCPLSRSSASSRLADGRTRHGGQRRRSRVSRADDPCPLSRSRPAAGLARCAKLRRATVPQSSISPWSH